jgi:tetratricopeptide (TPR) repeat protein
VSGAAARAAQAALDLVPADPRRARADAGLALGIARRERDPEARSVARSVAYRALGLATHDLGDLHGALAATQSAVRIADKAGLAGHAAQARMSRAFILLSLGRLQAALRDADAAVASMQGVDRARALAQQGLVLQRAGELDRALAVYGVALPALRRHGDRLWEARLRSNRAILHAFQGHHGRARSDIMQAADLHAALRKTRALARSKLNLGVIEGMHGDIPAALAAIDRAADEYRKGGWPMAAPLMEKAEVLLSAGLATEALTVVSAAVSELSQGRKAADLAEARLLLARAQLAAGFPGPASESAAAARRGFTRQQRPGWAAVARYVEAHAAWAAGDQSMALLRSARKAAAELDSVSWPTASLDLRLLAAQIATGLGHLEMARTELRAAARARNSAQLGRRARAWHALALLRVQAGDRRGAYAAVSAGLTAAERVRLLLGATELRVMVASHVSELAALGVSLAISDRSADRVLWSAERHRAASLRIRPVFPPADESLAALRGQLRATAGEAARAQLAGRPSQALSRRQHALEDQLRQRLRHYRGVPDGERSRLDGHAGSDAGVGAGLAPGESAVPGKSAGGLVRELADLLGDAVLLEYVECAGILHAVVVPGNPAPGGSAPASPAPGQVARPARRKPSLHALGPVEPLLAELESLRFAWRRLLTGHGSAASLDAAATLAAHAARQLDQALLAPLAALLGDRPLVVVPPGSLQSLPWPMLPGCAGRPVTVAPSAASWLAARPGPNDAHPVSPRVVLVAGPGLPEAVAEVGSLAALYPGAQVLAGTNATVAATLRALDGADIAHIAAHGRFRADNPMFSSVMLADGPLTVYDLERLRVAPNTIMLAACDTGLASTHPGDEMTGMATALLAVGARSVIAPLLPLPDKVAARLAHGWHDRLRAGLSPARALAASSCAAARDDPLARMAGAVLVCLGHGGLPGRVTRAARPARLQGATSPLPGPGRRPAARTRRPAPAWRSRRRRAARRRTCRSSAPTPSGAPGACQPPGSCRPGTCCARACRGHRRPPSAHSC